MVTSIPEISGRATRFILRGRIPEITCVNLNRIWYHRVYFFCVWTFTCTLKPLPNITILQLFVPISYHLSYDHYYLSYDHYTYFFQTLALHIGQTCVTTWHGVERDASQNIVACIGIHYIHKYIALRSSVCKPPHTLPEIIINRHVMLGLIIYSAGASTTFKCVL